jgi:hypothetical protein
LAASVQLGLSYRVSSCGAVPAAFFILVICWYGKEEIKGNKEGGKHYDFFKKINLEAVVTNRNIA